MRNIIKHLCITVVLITIYSNNVLAQEPVTKTVIDGIDWSHYAHALDSIDKLVTRNGEKEKYFLMFNKSYAVDHHETESNSFLAAGQRRGLQGVMRRIGTRFYLTKEADGTYRIRTNITNESGSSDEYGNCIAIETRPDADDAELIGTSGNRIIYLDRGMKFAPNNNPQHNHLRTRPRWFFKEGSANGSILIYSVDMTKNSTGSEDDINVTVDSNDGQEVWDLDENRDGIHADKKTLDWNEGINLVIPCAGTEEDKRDHYDWKNVQVGQTITITYIPTSSSARLKLSKVTIVDGEAVWGNLDGSEGTTGVMLNLNLSNSDINKKKKVQYRITEDNIGYFQNCDELVIQGVDVDVYCVQVGTPTVPSTPTISVNEANGEIIWPADKTQGNAEPDNDGYVKLSGYDWSSIKEGQKITITYTPELINSNTQIKLISNSQKAWADLTNNVVDQQYSTTTPQTITIDVTAAMATIFSNSGGTYNELIISGQNFIVNYVQLTEASTVDPSTPSVQVSGFNGNEVWPNNATGNHTHTSGSELDWSDNTKDVEISSYNWKNIQEGQIITITYIPSESSSDTHIKLGKKVNGTWKNLDATDSDDGSDVMPAVSYEDSGIGQKQTLKYVINSGNKDYFTDCDALVIQGNNATLYCVQVSTASSDPSTDPTTPTNEIITVSYTMPSGESETLTTSGDISYLTINAPNEGWNDAIGKTLVVKLSYVTANSTLGIKTSWTNLVTGINHESSTNSVTFSDADAASTNGVYVNVTLNSAAIEKITTEGGLVLSCSSGITLSSVSLVTPPASSSAPRRRAPSADTPIHNGGVDLHWNVIEPKLDGAPHIVIGANNSIGAQVNNIIRVHFTKTGDNPVVRIGYQDQSDNWAWKAYPSTTDENYDRDVDGNILLDYDKKHVTYPDKEDVDKTWQGYIDYKLTSDDIEKLKAYDLLIAGTDIYLGNVYLLPSETATTHGAIPTAIEDVNSTSETDHYSISFGIDENGGRIRGDLNDADEWFFISVDKYREVIRDRAGELFVNVTGLVSDPTFGRFDDGAIDWVALNEKLDSVETAYTELEKYLEYGTRTRYGEFYYWLDHYRRNQNEGTALYYLTNLVKEARRQLETYEEAAYTHVIGSSRFENIIKWGYEWEINDFESEHKEGDEITFKDDKGNEWKETVAKTDPKYDVIAHNYTLTDAFMKEYGQYMAAGIFKSKGYYRQELRGLASGTFKVVSQGFCLGGKKNSGQMIVKHSEIDTDKPNAPLDELTMHKHSIPYRTLTDEEAALYNSIRQEIRDKARLVYDSCKAQIAAGKIPEIDLIAAAKFMEVVTATKGEDYFTVEYYLDLGDKDNTGKVLENNVLQIGFSNEEGGNAIVFADNFELWYSYLDYVAYFSANNTQYDYQETETTEKGVDIHVYNAPVDLYLRRNFNPGWNPIVLPFDISLANLAEFDTDDEPVRLSELWGVNPDNPSQILFESVDNKATLKAGRCGIIYVPKEKDGKVKEPFYKATNEPLEIKLFKKYADDDVTVETVSKNVYGPIYRLVGVTRPKPENDAEENMRKLSELPGKIVEDEKYGKVVRMTDEYDQPVKGNPGKVYRFEYTGFYHKPKKDGSNVPWPQGSYIFEQGADKKGHLFHLDQSDWGVIYGSMWYLNYLGIVDKEENTPPSSQAPVFNNFSVIINGEYDEEATQMINDMVTNGMGGKVLPNGKVYNLSGQYLGTSADLSTLPKGVYVVDGKKYVKQ